MSDDKDAHVTIKVGLGNEKARTSTNGMHVEYQGNQMILSLDFISLNFNGYNRVNLLMWENKTLFHVPNNV